MEKILITGGCGYVGSRVANKMAEQGWSVVVVDKATPEERGVTFHENVEFVHLHISIVNQEKLEKVFDGIDTVLHLAADIGPINYMYEKSGDIMYNNMEADTALYKALQTAGVGVVVYSSSSMVYQEVSEYPYTEEVTTKIPPPKNIYGFSKLAGEYFCKGYLQQYGLDYVIIRYHNIYGPGEDSKGSTPGDIHVIPALCEKIHNGQYPLEIIGNPKATRPFTHIDDAVEATIKVVELAHKKDASVVNNDFNIATPGYTSIEELGEKIWEKFGDDRPFKFVSIESKASNHSSFRREVDVSKAKEILGFEGKIALDKGLDDTMEWIKTRERS